MPRKYHPAVHTTPFKEHQPHGAHFDQGDGYMRVYCPEHPACDKRGCVLFHQLVVEKSIGRYLSGMEEVHHEDRNRSNNAIENLTLCKDHAEHMRLHRSKVLCRICGEPQRCKGLCSKHYSQKKYHVSRRVHCAKCGKDIARVPDKTEQLCRACKFPNRKCACGQSVAVMGLCNTHHDQWKKSELTYESFKRGLLGGKSVSE